MKTKVKNEKSEKVEQLSGYWKTRKIFLHSKFCLIVWKNNENINYSYFTFISCLALREMSIEKKSSVDLENIYVYMSNPSKCFENYKL